MRKRSHKIAITGKSFGIEAILPDELPSPWNHSLVFGRVAPLELEIGSGRGLFIKNAARSTPGHDFLGIEISHKYSKHCATLLVGNHLNNAVMVCGDAELVLREHIPDTSLTAVHIYFPDPWWKRKHRKRRIVCEPVIRLIRQKLISGGKIHFWTDVEEYFFAGLASFAKVSGLEGPFSVEEKVAEHDFDYHTHFERRTRLHNETVYRSFFVKK